MDELSLQQRIDIILSPKIHEGHTAICSHFNQQNPGLNINNNFVSYLIKKFKKNGHVFNRDELKNMKKKEASFEQEDKVHHVINENPHSSIARTSAITGVCQSTIQQMLKTQGFHPYKLTELQEIIIHPLYNTSMA